MSYLEMFGRWLIDIGQQLIPTLNAVIYMLVAIWIYRLGRSER
jgi:hypothetical protein